MSKKKHKNPDNLSGRYSSYANSIVSGEIPAYHLQAEEEIKELMNDGASVEEIAEELGLLVENVYRAVKRLKKSS